MKSRAEEAVQQWPKDQPVLTGKYVYNEGSIHNNIREKTK
jgi:hypothetical protein